MWLVTSGTGADSNVTDEVDDEDDSTGDTSTGRFCTGGSGADSGVDDGVADITKNNPAIAHAAKRSNRCSFSPGFDFFFDAVRLDGTLASAVAGFRL